MAGRSTPAGAVRARERIGGQHIQDVAAAAGMKRAAELAVQLPFASAREKLAGADVGGPSEDADHLSFLLAGSLPLDLDFKQKLLGLRSEAKRIQTVIEYFEGILPNLRRAVQIRQKAGGNGHSH